MRYIDVEIKIDEEKWLEEVNEELEKVANNVVRVALQKILMADKFVFGWLYYSSRVEKIRDGEYEIGFDAPYSAVVEFGRGKNKRMPPVMEIAMWLMMKFDYDRDKAIDLAYPIAKNIAKFGIEPYPFLRLSVNEVLEEEVFTGKERWEDLVVDDNE